MPDVFRIVLGTSISAGITALMVIAARLITGRRPGFMLRLLFILLIIRLAVPVSVPSPLSIQNLFNASVSQFIPEALSAGISGGSGDPGMAAAQGDIPAAEVYNTPAASHIGGDINEAAAAAPVSVIDICVVVWLCGIAVFSALLIFGNLRFMKALRKNREYSAPGFDVLFSACKDELGIRQRIKTVRASAVSAAAVYGAFRPRLLVSPSFERLSDSEKRHVLLHELSHIKRGDNFVCLLASVLCIIHWFNPIVWIAFTLMRKDIEVMCDTEVLDRTGDRHGYALTLLNLASLNPAEKPRFVSALFVSTDAIKRRINMIAKNKKKSIMITITGMILVIATAVCGCTEAVQPSPETSAQNTLSGPGVFTLKDGSITVNVPEGWHAKDISKGVTYSMGCLVSDDESNEINIEYKRTMGDKNVTPESVMGQTIFVYTTEDGSGVTYTERNEGETPESVMGQTIFVYTTEDGSGVTYTEGNEGETPGSAAEITVTIKGDRLVTYNVSNGSGETLTVNGTEGKLYSLTGGEQQGYIAIFVANGKIYKISYFADSEEFETNKDLVKSVISSAKFS